MQTDKRYVIDIAGIPYRVHEYTTTGSEVVRLQHSGEEGVLLLESEQDRIGMFRVVVAERA